VRILIVEDEARLARTVKDIMEDQHYSADIAPDGEAGLDDAMSGIYDVILMDVMLPKMDGFAVVRRLREENVRTPIIMLTARTQLGDRVQGLDSGADYYLTKPFETSELLACIRAVARRQSDSIVLDEAKYGDLTLNLSSYLLSCGEKSVRLSRTEFEIMRLLMINQANILTKETLITKVWGYDSDVYDNNVEAYISFLRKKLAHLKSGVTIHTVRMVGYHLELGGEE
jgi:DNA-binding response OmpR family regulator